MISAIHEHESAIGIHVFPWLLNCPPTSLPSPPFWVITEHQLWVSCIIQQTPTHHCTYGDVHILILLSEAIPPSPSPAVTISLFFMSESPLLPCK